MATFLLLDKVISWPGRNNAISVPGGPPYSAMITSWHPRGMPAKNLEMYKAFALSSTPSLRWHGPLVQTARQSFTISAGWTIRVYLQSKLWVWDGRLRFIQTTCHEFW